jgi:hypothetical protein
MSQWFCLIVYCSFRLSDLSIRRTDPYPQKNAWSLVVIHQCLRRQYQALNNRRWCGVGGGVGGGGGGSDGRASYRSRAILCACLKGQPPAKERLVTRDGIAPILFFEARHSLVALVGELAADR